MNKRFPPARLWKGWLLAMCLGVTLAMSPATAWLELKWLDTGFSLLRQKLPRTATAPIVIVGIDDATFAAFPEPFALWHARLAVILEGIGQAEPQAVGLDVELPQRSYDFILPGQDLILYTALRELASHTPLVLARGVDASGKLRPLHLPFAIAAGAGNIGLSAFPLDIDGAVRRFDEFLDEKNRTTPSLAGNLVRRLGHPVESGLIDFTLGPAMTYVPVQDVWQWTQQGKLDRLRNAFRGRIVLLGSVLPFEDQHQVSVPLAAWRQDTRSAGILVHAQALRSLLGPGLVRQAPSWADPALALIGSLLWFAGARAGWALIVLLLFTGGLALLSLGLLHAGLHLPVAGAALSALLGCAGRLGREARFQFQERQRLRNAFEGYVSPAVLHLILDGRLDSELGSGRRAVCVLFADVRDFTTLSEGTPPEAVVALLNRYFECMTPIIHHHGGTVDNFRGDGIMCMFGAPQPVANPCLAGLAAARQMLGALDKLNETLLVEGQRPLAIGIGLAFGDAVVGRLGAANRHVYSAIGDVANVSARLESLTKELGYPLLVSAGVADAVAEHVRFDDLGERGLKGHTPVRVWGWPPRTKQ